FGPEPDRFEIADHVHQALQVTPPLTGAAGHIYFPVAGAAVEGQCGMQGGGIQGFSWVGDQLTSLGLAQVRGSATRGWQQGGHLISVSDQALQAFSLGDPSAPLETSSVELTSAASAFAVYGNTGHLVSYSRADAQYRFDLTSGLQPNPGNAGASSPASVAIDYPTAVDGCARS